jgi:hypothetical protein
MAKFASKAFSILSPLSPGLQIYNVDMGEKPKAVIACVTKRTADGGDSDALLGYGFAAGSAQQFCGALLSDSGATAGDVQYSAASGRLIRLIDQVPRVILDAEFVAFGGNTIAINWLAVDVRQYVVLLYAIGGDDVQRAHAGIGNLQAATGDQEFDGPGWTPDALLIWTPNGLAAPFSSSTNVTAGGTVSCCLGMAAGGSQAYAATLHTDAADPTVTKRRVRTDRVFAALTSSGVDCEASFLRFTSVGFTLSVTTAPASPRPFFYLALKGPRATVALFTMSTSNGAQAVSVPFQPAGLLFGSASQAVSTTTNAHGRMQFGAASAVGQEWTAGFSDTDNVGTSVSGIDIRRNRCLRCQGDGTEPDATFAGFTGTGFSVTVANADATARRVFCLALAQQAPSTAFEVLKSSADRAIAVVALLLPRLVPVGWASAAPTFANTYQVTVAKRITHTSTPAGIAQRVVGVEHDGMPLTEASSVADVDAHAASWFWDASTGVLSVRLAGGGDPDDKVVDVICELRAATTGLNLNLTDSAPNTGQYHEPWVTARVPTMTSVAGDFVVGVTTTAGGELVLTNGHAIFHRLCAWDSGYRWTGAQVKLYAGGSYWLAGVEVPLKWSEYVPLVTMQVRYISPSDTECTLTLSPISARLERSLPITPIFEAEYPRLGEGVRGTRKPIIYGKATITPILVDTEQRVYLLADAAAQDLYAVREVRAMRQAATGDVAERAVLRPGVDYTESLAACTITLTAGGAAIYPAEEYKFEVDLVGKTNGLGGYLKYPGEIARDMAMVALKLTDDDFASFTFAAADEEWDAELSVVIAESRSLASLLNSVEQGAPSIGRCALATFLTTATGRLMMRVLDPSYSTDGLVHVRGEDLASFVATAGSRELVAGARVHYGHNYATGEWTKTAEFVNPRAEPTVGSADLWDIYTYLDADDRFHAQILAERYAFLLTEPGIEIEFSERGSLLAMQQASDAVLVTRAPAPTRGDAYEQSKLQLLRLEVTPMLRVSGRLWDYAGLVDRVGVVPPLADENLDFSTATAEQRRKYVWVSNDVGEAAPGDAATRNRSVIW